MPRPDIGTQREAWDQIHQRRDRDRLGRPHDHLVDLLTGMPPGRALELGSGDGADAIWLAHHGWEVTAVDVSPVILAIAAGHAERLAVASAIDWVQGDLDDWETDETFDLVCSFFLHPRLAFDRTGALGRAARQVRSGGKLLVVGHRTLPPWAWDPDDGAGLPSTQELADGLALDPSVWRMLEVEDRPRTVKHADGREAEVVDAIVHAERTTEPSA